jgi:mono/diheme cytochrome c family protein
MLALSDALSVALLISGAVLVVLALAVLFLRGRTKERGPDIPPAMRPGPADAALETPLLQKLMGWGVVLVAFFVVWIPFTWLREPSENLKQEEDLKTQAIARGARAVAPFSEDNQGGVNCMRCHGTELRGGIIQSGVDANGNLAYAYPPNLTTVCGGPSTGHGAIKSLADIYTTIEQGRGAMPSWSIKFQGALDDQQINDIVQYLVFMSSKNVPFDENVCINKDAADAAATPTPAAAAGASGGASSGESAAGSGSAAPAASATPEASP